MQQGRFLMLNLFLKRGSVMTSFVIKNIYAREVLDSRGFPTVEVDLMLSGPKELTCYTGRAIVPSGASTGEGEALELRDEDAIRYLGKGVLKAVANIKEKITPPVLNQSFDHQAAFDHYICALDGTSNKSKLGANAILAVSMAFLRASALARKTPCYQLIAEIFGSQGVTLPVPLMNILNGGKHADNGLSIQEFMIVPIGFSKFSEALRAGVEIFHQLKKILQAQHLSTGVGDEGGFSPCFEGAHPHEQALKAILEAIQSAGYKPGVDIFLALDSAASEFTADGVGQYRFEGKKISNKELTEIYQRWVQSYPIISLEDGLAEHDWEGWSHLIQTLGAQVQLVGDDLFVTHPVLLKKGIENNIANAILIKLNQIGSVTETLGTMRVAAQAHYQTVTSHRSGETEDTFIADLAVGTDCGQIKTGSASRTDRIAKYNQLLRIEEDLKDQARFAGRQPFKKLHFNKRS
jgi:enolase